MLNAAVDAVAAVLIVVELHVVDVHPHIGDLIQIVLAVVDKQQLLRAQITLHDRDRLISCISPSMIEDNILRILMEIDGLNVIVFPGGIDCIRIVDLGVVSAVEGVGSLLGEVFALAVRAAQHGALHGCFLSGKAVEGLSLIVTD